jgi:hypothetical protein
MNWTDKELNSNFPELAALYALGWSKKDISKCMNTKIYNSTALHDTIIQRTTELVPESHRHFIKSGVDPLCIYVALGGNLNDINVPSKYEQDLKDCLCYDETSSTPYLTPENARKRWRPASAGALDTIKKNNTNREMFPDEYIDAIIRILAESNNTTVFELLSSTNDRLAVINSYRYSKLPDGLFFPEVYDLIWHGNFGCYGISDITDSRVLRNWSREVTK